MNLEKKKKDKEKKIKKKIKTQSNHINPKQTSTQKFINLKQRESDYSPFCGEKYGLKQKERIIHFCSK